MRQVATDAQRLASADRVYQQGDIRVASTIYTRLALARSPNPITFQARQRLNQLAQEARDKLREIDAAIMPSAAAEGASASESIPADKVIEAFQNYEDIADNYCNVPAVKREVAAHVARQRKKPEYAAVLNEGEAKRLLDLARDHERLEELCCAYWVYQDAAQLAPAPSALEAGARFDVLAADPETVRAAEICRELRWCHKAYQRAEMLVKITPKNARRVYGEILERAPEDSEIYRAARCEYDALANR